MQHTKEARERLTLGFWLVLAGTLFVLIAMVLPIGTEYVGRSIAPTGTRTISIIDSFGSTVVIGLPVLAGAALAFWLWNNGRGVAWPIVIVGVLVSFFGLAGALGADEPGIGGWTLLLGGILLIGGGLVLSVVIRRVRFNLNVAAQVQQQHDQERMPAPAAALPPAGWFEDPRSPTNLRYWNGSRWTDATRHGAGEAVSMPPPVA